MELQAAVGTFALTGKRVDDAIGRIPTAQWLERPAPKSNHVLWIIGHLATRRSLVLRALGERREPTKLDPLFAGGIPLQEDAAYPSPAVVIAAWREMAIRPVNGRRSVVVPPVEPVVLEHRDALEPDAFRCARNRAALEAPLASGWLVHHE